MKSVFTLVNVSGDLNRMINNINETLGVFITYDDAYNAMNKSEYIDFDMVIEEIELGNANPHSNVLHCWERNVNFDNVDATTVTFKQLF